MSINELRMYATIPSAPAECVDITLNLTACTMVRMAMQACFVLGSYVRQGSENYVVPEAYVQDSALEVDELRLRQQYPGIQFRDNLGRYQFVQAWDGLKLVDCYVQLVNAYPDRWHVGEEGWSREVVYRTLVDAHNWSVLQIQNLHKQSGKNFGSAMRQQREYLTAAVKDWPERYKFRARAILPLPKDVPGYYDQKE